MKSNFIQLFTYCLVAFATFSCSPKKTDNLLIGSWETSPVEDTKWKVTFYKDETITVTAMKGRPSETDGKLVYETSKHFGTYKMINDGNGISLNLTFEMLYFSIEDDKPSFVSILKLTNDVLTIDSETKTITFKKVKE